MPWITTSINCIYNYINATAYETAWTTLCATSTDVHNTGDISLHPASVHFPVVALVERKVLATRVQSQISQSWMGVGAVLHLPFASRMQRSSAVTRNKEFMRCLADVKNGMA